jgi:hypothetical protein
VLRQPCQSLLASMKRGKAVVTQLPVRKRLTRQHPFQLIIPTLAVVGSPACREKSGKHLSRELVSKSSSRISTCCYRTFTPLDGLSAKSIKVAQEGRSLVKTGRTYSSGVKCGPNVAAVPPANSFQHMPESLAKSESCGVAKPLFRAWGVQNHDVIRELVFVGARKLHRIRCF